MDITDPKHWYKINLFAHAFASFLLLLIYLNYMINGFEAASPSVSYRRLTETIGIIWIIVFTVVIIFSVMITMILKETLSTSTDTEISSKHFRFILIPSGLWLIPLLVLAFMVYPFTSYTVSASNTIVTFEVFSFLTRPLLVYFLFILIPAILIPTIRRLYERDILVSQEDKGSEEKQE